MARTNSRLSENSKPCKKTFLNPPNKITQSKPLKFNELVNQHLMRPVHVYLL